MKILLADDHALFREGMRHVLLRLDDAVEVIEAGDCAEALAQAERQDELALVLLDLQMPGMDGLDALEVFAERHPTLPVVVLSASEDRRHMQRALESGAMGFVPKAATAAVMLGALRLVLSGGIYVPPELVRAPPATGPKARPQDVAAAAGQLTPRQREVLALMVAGKPNKVIASELDLSEATVKAHVTAVMRAFQVSNRTQAVMAAEKSGIRFPRLRR